MGERTRLIRSDRAALLAVLLIFAFLAPPSIAANAENEHNSDATTQEAPTGGQYYRLDPFVVPIMGREAVARHLTVAVTLELTDENKRDTVRDKLPLLRHGLNTALYQLVGVQRSDGSLPPLAAMKRRMLDVSREVVGPQVVRDVLMESVYERKLR